MKTTPLFIGLAMLLTIMACDLVDESPCGPWQNYDLYRLGHGTTDSSGGDYYSYLDGNNRVFQWSKLIEGVCPEEHVKFNGRVALLDESVTGITAKAGMSWYFFYERLVTLNKNGSDLKGEGDAGLKQAFDKDTAWFVPKLEITFPTKGNYHADTSFLYENVISVELMAHYRKM